MVQIITLVKLSSIGGLACVAVMTSHTVLMTKKANQTPYFQEAMEILRNHSAARLLGDPIRSGWLDIAKSFADDDKVNLYVNVKGSNIKGKLFVNAVRDESEENWLLNRIELEMKDKAGGKVLIYDKNEENINEQ